MALFIPWEPLALTGKEKNVCLCFLPMVTFLSSSWEDLDYKLSGQCSCVGERDM